ncbi:MAG TPA: hypothetical protein VFZ54_17805 [Burkholderiales bacterium]
MGHLAERYRDASRSGVYRVSDAAIPRAAAAEAGNGSEVVIIEGLDRVPEDELQPILATFERIAAARRKERKPFFAVFIDPLRVLPLPTLYKERL